MEVLLPKEKCLSRSLRNNANSIINLEALRNQDLFFGVITGDPL